MGFLTFWVFAGINVAGFLLGKYLPETKDTNLEEIGLTYKEWFHPSTGTWTARPTAT